MRRTLVLTISIGLVLAGCAENPKSVSLKLDDGDPAFASADCRDVRNAATRYDDKVLSRAGEGLALGLFLGPFGLPFAAAIDAHQNQERKYLDQELALRCKSHGQPIEQTAAAPTPPRAIPVKAEVFQAPQPARSAPIVCKRYAIRVETDPTQNVCAD